MCCEYVCACVCGYSVFMHSGVRFRCRARWGTVRAYTDTAHQIISSLLTRMRPMPPPNARSIGAHVATLAVCVYLLVCVCLFANALKAPHGTER